MARKRKNAVGGLSTDGTKKKKWNARNVLHSPFALSFPPAAPGISEIICDILRRVFPQPPLRRPRVRQDSSESEDSDISDSSLKKYHVNQKVSSCKESNADIGIQHQQLARNSSESEHGVTHMEHGSRDTRIVTATECSDINQENGGNSEDKASEESMQVAKLEGICIGVNEVTRALERGKVALVVVARDVSPPLLVAHIPVLCFMKDAEIVPVNGGGGDMASCLGVKRLLAFGVADPFSISDKKSRKILEELLNALKKHTCKLEYPWLQSIRGISPVPKLPEPIFAPPSRLDSHI